MAYRLPANRSSIEVEGGLSVEVQDILSWAIYQTAVGLAQAYFDLKGAAAITALETAFTFFCVEAQPTWEIMDHRGVIPATPAGMLRLPLAMSLGIISEWCAKFVAEPETSAVDELIPAGPLRDRLNKELRAVA